MTVPLKPLIRNTTAVVGILRSVAKIPLGLGQIKEMMMLKAPKLQLDHFFLIEF